MNLPEEVLTDTGAKSSLCLKKATWELKLMSIQFSKFRFKEN